MNFFETFKFAAILTLHSSQRQYYPDTTTTFFSRWRPLLLRVRTKFWKGPTEPCKFWWAKCARSEVMQISFTGTVPLHEYSPRPCKFVTVCLRYSPLIKKKVISMGKIRTDSCKHCCNRISTVPCKRIARVKHLSWICVIRGLKDSLRCPLTIKKLLWLLRLKWSSLLAFM